MVTLDVYVPFRRFIKMMMKYIIPYILVICLVVSCTAIQERLAIKECKFSLVSVTPHDFTFSNLKLDFEIKGENPNPINAVLDKLTYTFYVNDTNVFSGTTGQGITIPAGKSKNFSTTITLEYANIGDALIEVIKLQTATYTIKARAYVSTVVGEISYPVDISL
jgi:LEA14-like dessication related protein